MIVVLFTASYPFDSAAEQTFLKDEVYYLSDHFEKVVLIPRKCEGNLLPVPANVSFAGSYSAYLTPIRKFFAAFCVLFSPLLYRDLFAHPWLVFHPPSLARLFAFLVGATLTKQWVESWLDENQIPAKECVFYTYWFDQGAMGIGMAKNPHPDIRLVSRVHGYDLYAERYSPPYWPGRPASLEVVDALLPDSLAGMEYLMERYPAFSSKFEVSRLGVMDPGCITPPSSDGVFRITSCSIIRPVKRVDLLLESVVHAARQRPHQKIEWHHFGNSEVAGVREEMQKKADELLPGNACAFFHGYSTQSALMEYYRTNSVDVFVNVSVSEGTPVSSMEALCCGIPLIATGVGGNREIVTASNGFLLPPNPSVEEVVDALFRFLDSPAWAAKKRQGSLSLWLEQYHSGKNLSHFLGILKRVRKIESLK